MTQLSWAETRKILDAHSKAISQLYVNCDALKASMDGEVHDGHIVSAPLVKLNQLLSLTFWGRLRWALTGHLPTTATGTAIVTTNSFGQPTAMTTAPVMSVID